MGNSVNAFGAWSTSAYELAVANSRGIWGYSPRTVASLKIVVMASNGTGYAERTGVDASRIDVDGAGEEAVTKALKARDPIAIEPGAYTVVLEPYAVGTMIDYLAYMGLDAMSVQEGRSFMAGHFGERLAGESITIWDDGLDPNGIPTPFDFEGVPKQKVVFLERGIATGVAYDSFTAGPRGQAVHGPRATGGVRLRPDAPQPFSGARRRR